MLTDTGALASPNPWVPCNATATSRHGRCILPSAARRGRTLDSASGRSRRDERGGNRHTAHEQGEQRSNGTSQNLRRVGATSEPGRQHAPDEAEYDQPDCSPHGDNPPNEHIANEMPSCRTREVRVEPLEMSSVVTLGADGMASRSSNLYRVIIAPSVKIAAGGRVR